jgi:hypothetical protein
MSVVTEVLKPPEVVPTVTQPIITVALPVAIPSIPIHYILALVIVLYLIWRFKIKRKSSDENRSGGGNPPPSNSSEYREYLEDRLQQIQEEASYIDGSITALTSVRHVYPVLDKIQELDDRHEKLKTEEFSIKKLLRGRREGFARDSDGSSNGAAKNKSNNVNVNLNINNNGK